MNLAIELTLTYSVAMVILVSIGMITVGAQYSNTAYCRNLNIPFILISAGVFNIIAAVTNAGITFLKVQDVRVAVRFISVVILFVIYLWASITTYSSYRHVQHIDPKDDNYCNVCWIKLNLMEWRTSSRRNE